MRPEDIIALMRNFHYDENKVSTFKQSHWNLRLPHTTRDEGLCTTIESALFAFGRLSEQGGQHQYAPDIFFIKGTKKDEIIPFSQALCLYKLDRRFNLIGNLQIPSGFFLKSNKTKKDLINTFVEELKNNNFDVNLISHLNPKYLSQLRRTLRDAQSFKKSNINFPEIFPDGTIIKF